MLYTRFYASPGLATVTRFNGLRISQNFHKKNMREYVHKPTQCNQPLPSHLCVFNDKTLGDQLPTQKMGSGSKSYLPRSTLPGEGQHTITQSICNNKGSLIQIRDSCHHTFYYPAIPPVYSQPLDNRVLHLAVIWQLLTELGQEFAQELLVRFRALNLAKEHCWQGPQVRNLTWQGHPVDREVCIQKYVGYNQFVSYGCSL